MIVYTRVNSKTKKAVLCNVKGRIKCQGIRKTITTTEKEGTALRSICIARMSYKLFRVCSRHERRRAIAGFFLRLQQFALASWALRRVVERTCINKEVEVGCCRVTYGSHIPTARQEQSDEADRNVRWQRSLQFDFQSSRYVIFLKRDNENETQLAVGTQKTRKLSAHQYPNSCNA
jgi:hypothetical protein